MSASTNVEQRLHDAQRVRNALLSHVEASHSRGGGLHPLRAAMQAPPVQHHHVAASAASTAADGGALDRSFDGQLRLVRSPYPQRRAAIAFTAYDRPWDGAMVPQGEDGADPTAFVQPQPLPGCLQSSTDAPSALLKTLTKDHDGSGPYGRPLTFVMSDDAVPFSAVLTTLAGAGFTLVKGRQALLHKSWSLQWRKRVGASDFLAPNLSKFQKLNHFPGTWRLGRKDELHTQLTRARERVRAYEERHAPPQPREGGRADSAQEGPAAVAATGSSDADFFPQGWIVPDDVAACTDAVRAEENRGKLFIVKPASSACGRGIVLLRGEKDASLPRWVTADDVPARARWRLPSASPRAQREGAASADDASAPVPMEKTTTTTTKVHDRLLIQRYVDDPFLVHGYKFDLRLYVVVTSFEPCRFYLYKDGLVRFATTPYRTRQTQEGDGDEAAEGAAEQQRGATAPMDDLTAHLTNFTINKKSEDFLAPQGDRRGSAAALSTPFCTSPDAEMPTAVDLTASKWCLSALEQHVRGLTAADGVSPLYDWDETMASIRRLLCETLLSTVHDVRGELRALAQRCGGRGGGTQDSSEHITPPPFTFRGVSPFFEIYGVDVLLRDAAGGPRHAGSPALPPKPLRPVLMEVNIMPSLSTHYTPLDQCIKGNFIADALTLVGLSATTLKAPATPTPCPGKSQSHPAGACGEAAASAADALVSYGEAFLDGLTSRLALEACLTAEEEARRSHHFTRLMPTPTSAHEYRPLLHDPSAAAACAFATHEDGAIRGTTLDEVLSAYETWKASRR